MLSPAVYSLLEAWVPYTPPSSPPCLQTLNTHTLVIVGLLTSDGLLALFFPPFCLQKEKHTAFVFQSGASSLSTITVKLLKECLNFFSFCCMVLLWKVTTKTTFTSVGLLWNATTQGNFSTKKPHMVKRDLFLVLKVLAIPFRGGITQRETCTPMTKRVYFLSSYGDAEMMQNPHTMQKCVSTYSQFSY